MIASNEEIDELLVSKGAFMADVDYYVENLETANSSTVLETLLYI